MGQATLARDHWELRSGEASHFLSPKTFLIPPRKARESLYRGRAALLIFDIETRDEAGVPLIQGERMWVIVAARIDGGYLGILDNQPTTQPAAGDFRLQLGTEVAFGPEHVIDVGFPPANYVAERLSHPPDPPAGNSDH